LLGELQACGEVSHTLHADPEGFDASDCTQVLDWPHMFLQRGRNSLIPLMFFTDAHEVSR
jgi:hypothetical protein